MTITLNHTIVPAHDKDASARFFARAFGLAVEEPIGHFAAVRINETLTLDFSSASSFDSHHYAFHVSDNEFDTILKRVQDADIAYGNAPFSRESLENRQLNSWNGGRGFYFRDPNGHILELLTRT